MIACPNCAKENQDHYKFCLACGAKLPAAGAPAPAPDLAPPPSQPSAPPVVSPPGPPPAAPAATPPPPMHDASTATTASPGPAAAPREAPAPVAPPVAPAPAAPPPAAPAPVAAPPPPVGGPSPAPPAAPPPPAAAQAPAAHAPSSGTAPNGGPCPGCGFQNPPGFKFCGRCGATLDDGGGAAEPDVGTANTMFVSDPAEVQAAAAAHQAEMEAAAAAAAASEPPVAPAAPGPSAPSMADSGAAPEPVTAPQPVVPAEPEPEPEPEPGPAPAPDGPPAKLVMLGPDGQPVGERALAPNERLEIGRECGPPWDDDAYLDPHHARVTVTQEGLQIEDNGSLNGVFVKLNTRVEVQDGDQFRVGQELVQYEDLPEPTPTEDGTERMGSPNPGYWGRLSILVDPDGPSMAFPIEGDGIMIGREHGDITFPQDGYVSGKHCRVVGDDTGVYMEDLGSSNGTYMRVRSGVTLPFGSLVLIGQKLFQIERLD